MGKVYVINKQEYIEDQLSIQRKRMNKVLPDFAPEDEMMKIDFKSRNLGYAHQEKDRKLTYGDNSG